MEEEYEENISSTPTVGGKPQSETSDSTTNISNNPKENTRRYIAYLYVGAFFGIILITLLIGLFKNFSVNDYKDILVTVSGVLSGPLGFIVGYYFKASGDK